MREERDRMLNDHTSVKVPGVPKYNQYPELPTGCEATALAMLLGWGGCSVSKFDVVEKLPKGKKVRLIDGEWRGANPAEQFVGDPYSDDGSFGVFEGPILATIEAFMPGKGINLTGQHFGTLQDILKSGKPVLAWTTINQKETFRGKTWQDENGVMINWYSNEHAVVITGVDGDQVIVNDPYTGKEEHYNKEGFEANWASMGKRAVTLDVA